MQTVGECVDRAARRLKVAGIETARMESRLLLAHCLGVNEARVIGYPEAPVEDVAGFERLVSRRAAREPLSRILGRREFWSLPFRITPDTLDPRPDSETTIEAALRALGKGAADRAVSILDLGTGSGCLLLSLLHELPLARGLGVDISPGAARVARDNAVALGMSGRAGFVVADWAAPLSGRFDVVLSNPPYIQSCEIEDLEPEVAFGDPRLALDGGPDGLDCYRSLAAALSNIMSVEGVAVFEIGAGMDGAVEKMMSEIELKIVERASDISGKVRVLVFKKFGTRP